jgi:hypothetical protein
MTQAKTAIAALTSRRNFLRSGSAVVAAGAALALPTAAIAETESLDDKAIEMAQRPLKIMGGALVDNRVDVKWSKSKTGQTKSSVFTFRLDGDEDAEFMGHILAGTVLAGLITAEELIAKLENARSTAKA